MRSTSPVALALLLATSCADPKSGADGVDSQDSADTSDGSPLDPGHGLLDESGFALRPGRVLVHFAAGTTREAAEAHLLAAGATATRWLGPEPLTSLGAIATYAERDGQDALATLQAFEQALVTDPMVEDITRDWVVEVTATTRATDNESLAATFGRAFALVGDADARRVMDECAWRLDPDDLVRTAELCVVDQDLLGARDSVALAGEVASFLDVHAHADEEFCGTTPSGGQRPCEPNTVDQHGSAVASVIAALNDGATMNGLLGGFEGSGAVTLSDWGWRVRLKLFNVGHGQTGSMLDMLAGLEAAARSRCRVVNMSMSARIGPLESVRGYLATNRSFSALIDAYPETLFVLAAGNQQASLNGVAYWQSHRADNLLIVGATDDSDAAASFTNFGQGRIDLAAPGVNVPMHAVDVRHTGTTAHPAVETRVIDPAGALGMASGTSLSSPLVAAAAGFMKTFEPASQPAAIKSRLRASAKPIADKNLGERRLDVHQLVTSLIADRLATSATHLMSVDMTVTFAGDAGCEGLERSFGQPCVPVVVQGGALSVPGNIEDSGGHTIALTGTLGAVGAGASLTFRGLAVTPGIGPSETTLSGTARAVPDRANDRLVEGTVSGHSLVEQGAPRACTWTGTFKARLHARGGD